MRNGTALKLAAVAALGLAIMGTRGAAADIYEDVGHLYSWEGGEQGLQQGMISGTVIKACGGDDFDVSTGSAVSRWSTALSHTTFQYSCSSPDVSVTTVDFSRCPDLEGAANRTAGFR